MGKYHTNYSISEVKWEIPVEENNRGSESFFPKVVSTKEIFFECLFCGGIFNTDDLRLHLKYEEGLEW